MANPPRPQFPPGVLEALKAGNKIEAIRLLRDATKMGLTEAKAMVEMLDKAKGMIGVAQAVANVAQGARPATIAKPVKPVKMRAAPAPAFPARRPGLSPGEVPRESSSAWGIVVLVLIGLAVAYTFVR